MVHVVHGQRRGAVQPYSRVLRSEHYTPEHRDDPEGEQAGTARARMSSESMSRPVLRMPRKREPGTAGPRTNTWWLDLCDGAFARSRATIGAFDGREAPRIYPYPRRPERPAVDIAPICVPASPGLVSQHGSCSVQPHSEAPAELHQRSRLRRGVHLLYDGRRVLLAYLRHVPLTVHGAGIDERCYEAVDGLATGAGGDSIRGNGRRNFLGARVLVLGLAV